ncbi:hypothetical protein [Bremerella sp.]|uniref:hypothetical protein n=1 Tax=Bremerella sp. TaxID=2795602 RepID=UPI00391D3A72
MSSHHHAAQPEKHGDGHTGHTPQVAVRDGNRLLCPCCGEVLMVLPEEPLNQVTSKKFNPPKIDQKHRVKRISCPTLDAIIARQEAEEEAAFQASMAPKQPTEVSPASPVEPEGPRYQADPIVVTIDPDIAAYEFPEHDPPPPPKRTRTRTPKIPLDKPWRMRDKGDRGRDRDRQPRRKERPLVDPWSYRSARIYAWMYYRMQRLNVQLIGEICAKQEEIEQLENDLTGTKPEQSTKQDLRVPRPSPLGRASQVPVPSTSETQPTIELNPHAHADVGMAPAGSTSSSVRRHAQEDLGVAPGELTQHSTQPNERGPP